MLHIKKIKPLYTSLVVTGDKFEKDIYDGPILVAKEGDLKLWQTVLFVGSAIREIAIGDKVMINAENYARKKYDKNSLHNETGDNYTVEYKFNWVSIDDENGIPQDCLLLNDRDCLFVFEGEEIEDESKKTKLILPKKKRFKIKSEEILS